MVIQKSSHLGQVEDGDASEKGDELEGDVEISDGFRIANLLADFGRQSQDGVDDQIPKRHERNKVIRLVRTVHAKAYDDCHQIHAEYHLLRENKTR